MEPSDNEEEVTPIWSDDERRVWTRQELGLDDEPEDEEPEGLSGFLSW